MIRTFLERLRQGHQTVNMPDKLPALPAGFQGVPEIDGARFSACQKELVTRCPTGAIGEHGLDLGKCVFCQNCAGAAAGGAINFGKNFRLASSDRNSLLLAGGNVPLVRPLDKRRQNLFKNSFKIRQVSAGGCGACEADTNVLNTLVWDLGRFGVQFVASPRHADAILVTGPVTANMKQALLDTYKAVPEPKAVIAVGTCAVSGGIYAGHEETNSGTDTLLPVDLYIPGCPPHPLTILHGILALLGKWPADK